MNEKHIAGLGVKVTSANRETLKILKTSIPAKPYVVYRIARDNFIAVTDLIGSEKLIPSFDKLDEFKLLMSLGMQSTDAYNEVWLNHV